MESFDWRTFERTWTNAIIDSINMVREAEGITVKKLRSRLVQGGWGVSEATLSGMLSGKKRGSMSIVEVVAFAWALGVPPLYLILGLPAAANLPGAPMWDSPAAPMEGSPTTPPRVADWFIGRTLLAGRDDLNDRLDKTSDDERVVSRLTSHAMRDVLTHAELLHVIRWQAAQLVAIAGMKESPLLEQVVHPSVRDQTFLWDAINAMSQARRNQRQLDGPWAVNLGPLPPVLEFVDRDEEAEDFTVEQLRTLTTERAIEGAEAGFQRMIEQLQETMPKGSNGAPTDPVE